MVSTTFSQLLNYLIEPINTCIKNNVPGPGTYGQGIEINKFGKYSISTIANSRAANWSPSKKRFIDENRHKREIPGPGVYFPSDYNGNMGYVLSTNKNLGSVKIKQDSYRKNYD
jgi:hypothetical protein